MAKALVKLLVCCYDDSKNPVSEEYSAYNLFELGTTVIRYKKFHHNTKAAGTSVRPWALGHYTQSVSISSRTVLYPR